MPAAIELGIALLALVMMVFAYAALKGYQFTFKPLLIDLGKLINSIAIPTPFGSKHVLGGLGNWFINLAETIERALAGFYLNTEQGVSYLFDQLAKQARWLGHELGALADAVDKKWSWWLAAVPPLAALWAAVHAVKGIGKLARTAVLPDLAKLRRAVATAEADAAGVESELEHLARGIDRTAKALGGRITRTGAEIGTAVGGLAGSIGLTWTWIQRLRHVLTKQGAAALVAGALATLGLGFLRCPRFAKAGKRACGMDASLLESLLADTLIIAGTVSLVEFAEGMQTVTADLIGPIRTFWRAT